MIRRNILQNKISIFQQNFLYLSMHLTQGWILILSIEHNIMKFPIEFLSHNYTSGNGIIDLRGSLNKFPDFFRMGTFIDSTHMKL